MKIQFEISADAELILQSLKRSTSLTTEKDLINNALSLFEWAVTEAQAGRIIAAVDEDKMEYEKIRMQVLEQAAQNSTTQPSTISGGIESR